MSASYFRIAQEALKELRETMEASATIHAEMIREAAELLKEIKGRGRADPEFVFHLGQEKIGGTNDD